MRGKALTSKSRFAGFLTFGFEQFDKLHILGDQFLFLTTGIAG